MSDTLPSVVIVGRPNVGKSTLFNRLTGTRRSIVTDEPGITRDRIYGAANWAGRAFEVVDTGGIVPGDKEMIPREILRQAQRAIESAAILLLVVDARAGVTPLDQELARLLRTTGRPLAIAANKVDTPELAAAAAAFYQLATDVYPVSSEHGLGVDELLEAVTAKFPSAEAEAAAPEVNVAIIGRPNVGKSTLLNQLVGEERAIVSEIPGTTRDAVDTVVGHNAKLYRFVDTAGIRRKGKTKLVAEKLSVVMARRHMERSDVVLLMVDAAQGVTAGDATIAGYAAESGRSVIIVMNKWDLAVELAREKFERDARDAAEHKRNPQPVRASKAKGKTAHGRASARCGESEKVAPARFDTGVLLREYETIVRAKLKFLDYAPVVFLSAHTGDRLTKLFPLIDQVAEARQLRVSTSELNRWLAAVDLDRGTSPAARRIKIYYVTQATSAPPTFVLFSNQARPLHFSYERFLENQLRQAFDFMGTPIFFRQRLKKR
ncbi:MAG TPA: ribosome biogenesis GTPase Der [Candidatus Acidoferrales bacterium]